jgi:hypothetical protein
MPAQVLNRVIEQISMGCAACQPFAVDDGRLIGIPPRDAMEAQIRNGEGQLGACPRGAGAPVMLDQHGLFGSCIVE